MKHRIYCFICGTHISENTIICPIGGHYAHATPLISMYDCGQKIPHQVSSYRRPIKDEIIVDGWLFTGDGFRGTGD